MSTSDGSVVGATKIIDHGDPASRWNMAILAEGYRASELDKFHNDAQRFVDHLYATAPFNDLWCAVNVYRVDVVSTDSGADDPATCADDPPGSGGSGATPATYFDASFCTNSTRRLLAGNEATALSVSAAQVPHVSVTMVLVNSPIYGGAGGGVAWFSAHPDSAEIGIHEMGHTYFGFVDEYGDITNTYSGADPSQPNATTNTNRATTKWHDLIAASTPVPTTHNPNCSAEDPNPSPVGAGVVGLFEGAARAHCGAYRAEFSCRMRTLGVAFCAVCQRRIRQLLTPFVPPTSVNLATPSIDFGAVPEGIGGTGVTTYRPIVLELTGCGPVTFRIDSGPTGGFGTPLGTSTPVRADEYGSIGRGRLWLSYTSTTAGAPSNGTVTVSCPETGNTWVVNIHARTVARPKSAVVLVLDHSGSMSEDAGDGTPKVEKLKQAVSTFAGLMLSGDGLGVVRFDDTVQRLQDVTDVGPLTPVMPGSGRAGVASIVAGNQLDPAGATSIGGGVAEGKATLDAAPATVPPWATKAMVVVTDGVENTPPWISDVSSSITSNTFAVGIGLPSNISVAPLNALTQNHNGYIVVTGAITQDVTFRLTKYFVQVLAGVSNAAVVVDPQGQLPIGVTHRIPFPICVADYGLDAIVLSEAAQLMDVRLETPDGTLIRPSSAAAGSNIQYVARDYATLYRVGLPSDPADPAGTHGGEWAIVLAIDKRKAGTRDGKQFFTGAAGGLRYNAIVHAYTDLAFDAWLRQTGYAPGAQAIVDATLSEYGVPVAGRAWVDAEVTEPDLGQSVIHLDEVAAGRFEGAFPATQPGVYIVRARANGTDFNDLRFSREKTLTAVVWVDDGRVGGVGQPPTDRLTQLLCCLLEQGARSEDVWRRLKDLGIDPDAVRRCIERECRDQRAG